MIATLIIVLLCLIALIPFAALILFVYELLWAWASEDYVDDNHNTIEK